MRVAESRGRSTFGSQPVEHLLAGLDLRLLRQMESNWGVLDVGDLRFIGIVVFEHGERAVHPEVCAEGSWQYLK